MCADVRASVRPPVRDNALSFYLFPSTDEEVMHEEELDKELLWNLQLLSEVRSKVMRKQRQL